ncbi:MAG: CHC2 zinc finger domain-containing protein, partial [Bacteroidota bacterium]|nr:CHC2 zinc finger domain-containing protein [Bacteroidota bacterium]
MISKSTIDQVYEAARLEEVIGEYVTLKKSGANYKGLSPFTQEKTPSFIVSPAKQIWKDFSSGKG